VAGQRCRRGDANHGSDAVPPERGPPHPPLPPGHEERHARGLDCPRDGPHRPHGGGPPVARPARPRCGDGPRDGSAGVRPRVSSACPLRGRTHGGHLRGRSRHPPRDRRAESRVLRRLDPQRDGDERERLGRGLRAPRHCVLPREPRAAWACERVGPAEQGGDRVREGPRNPVSRCVDSGVPRPAGPRDERQVRGRSFGVARPKPQASA